MQPTYCSFHNPTINAQPTPMLRPALGQMWFDSQPCQKLTGWLTVVRAIGVQLIGPRTRTTRLATNRRDVGDQRQEFHDVRRVGGGEFDLQGHALSFGQDVVFAAELPPIGRIWS